MDAELSARMATVLLKLVAVILFCTAVVYPQSERLIVRGEIRDQHEDLIVGARVSLTDPNKLSREVISDVNGAFRFGGLEPGRYELSIVAVGFSGHVETFSMRPDHVLPPLSIHLYPIISATVIVLDNRDMVGLEPQLAAGGKTLREQDLRSLPEDPEQLLDQLQILATSSGSAPGQATVTVDGFATNGRIVPKSSIREVKINPDLFSAEYDKAPYQGGRIEIYTKPGVEKWHGAGFYNFNDTLLNARQAFAPVRAPSSKYLFGGQLGGPLVRKHSGFFLDFESRRINELATVSAIIPNDDFEPTNFATSVPTPKRMFLGSARADWQVNPANTFIARFDFNENTRGNQGVGGFNLPDRAFNAKSTEKSVRLSATSIVSKTMVNEARLGLTVQHDSQGGVSTDPTIMVLGSFSQGSANVRSLEHHEQRLEFADTFSLVYGKHNLKFGTQVFAKRVTDQRVANTHGTFTFGGATAPELDANGQVVSDANGPILITISSFEQYRRTNLALPGGTPTRFSITIGSPKVAITQWLYAGFAQDEWRLRPNLNLSFGLRIEDQTSPGGQMSVAPRLGIAYSPDKSQRWILRARAGIFYDRISESLALETLRADGVQQQELITDQPGFPNPFLHNTLVHAIPLIRTLDKRIDSPATLQTQIGLERQLAKGWKIELSHYWTRGWSVLRSRNINAPLLSTSADGTSNDPLTAPRPSGVQENILQFESSGKIRGQVLYIGVNQTGNKYFRLYAGYLLFGFHSDTDSPFMLPQSSYDMTGEWARPIWQSRQRAFMGGTINLPWKVHASPLLNLASGTPFNITTGRDNNGDGSFTDRPSQVDAARPNAILTQLGAFNPAVVNGTMPRNAGTNSATMTFDLGLDRTFGFGAKSGDANRYQLTVKVNATNLLNHVNLLAYNGVVTSPFFGRANSAAPARQIVIGLRFGF